MHAESVQLAIPQRTNSLLLLIQLAPGEANILQALRVIAQYKLLVYRAQLYTGLPLFLPSAVSLWWTREEEWTEVEAGRAVKWLLSARHHQPAAGTFCGQGAKLEECLKPCSRRQLPPSPRATRHRRRVEDCGACCSWLPQRGSFLS